MPMQFCERVELQHLLLVAPEELVAAQRRAVRERGFYGNSVFLAHLDVLVRENH